MIINFKDAETERVFLGERTRKFPADILKTARRKLNLLDTAQRVEDLRAYPGNRLEKLIGNRAGQWSIRINDQWRICFRWDMDDDDPSDVEIVDYH